MAAVIATSATESHNHLRRGGTWRTTDWSTSGRVPASTSTPGGAVCGSLMSLCVCALDLAESMRETRSGLIEPVQGLDLVVAGARQFVLRCDDFDVSRNSCCKPPLCLRD